MLKTLYPKDRAKSLVELGDISSLQGKLSSNEPDFEPQDNYSDIVKQYMNKTTEAYHRDRGEDWNDVKPK